jgi:hypothetical protein
MCCRRRYKNIMSQRSNSGSEGPQTPASNGGIWECAEPTCRGKRIYEKCYGFIRHINKEHWAYPKKEYIGPYLPPFKLIDRSNPNGVYQHATEENRRAGGKWIAEANKRRKELQKQQAITNAALQSRENRRYTDSETEEGTTKLQIKIKEEALSDEDTPGGKESQQKQAPEETEGPNMDTRVAVTSPAIKPTYQHNDQQMGQETTYHMTVASPKDTGPCTFTPMNNTYLARHLMACRVQLDRLPANILTSGLTNQGPRFEPPRNLQSTSTPTWNWWVNRTPGPVQDMHENRHSQAGASGRSTLEISTSTGMQDNGEPLGYGLTIWIDSGDKQARIISRAIIGCASPDSYIPRKMTEKLGLNGRRDPLEVSSTPSGGKIITYGFVRLRIGCMGWKSAGTFLVVEGLNKITLGYRFLGKHGAVMDYKAGTITLSSPPALLQSTVESRTTTRKTGHEGPVITVTRERNPTEVTVTNIQ